MTSSASAKALVAEELSPIQSLGAAIQCENCGLGTGRAAFLSTLAAYRDSEGGITKRVPRRVIDKMVADGQDPTVGGATSIGYAHQRGFELSSVCEPVQHGQPTVRAIFNGLDMDTDVGQVGHYRVAVIGFP